MNRNWKDKSHETFKSVFSMLSTEPVYNRDKKSRQEMYLTIQEKDIHTFKIKLHAHAWACAHTYT